MPYSLEKLVSESLYVIRNHSGQNPVVSFSGGKDSLVALDLSIRAGIEKAVFSDTTIEFKETIRYVNAIRTFYGIQLDVVHPPKSFFELMDVLGFPSRRLRWCCDALKFGPLGKYALDRGTSSFITGLRSNESRKRNIYSYVGKNPLLPATQLNPLVKWTETDVWNYIYEFSLPVNPLYKLGLKRIGCWPCPFKTEDDWEITSKNFPHLVKELNTRILKVAKEFNVGIKNPEDFVENRAWVKHAFTQTSKVKGRINVSPHELRISADEKNDLYKISKLLPVMARDYSINDRDIIVRDVRNLKRLKILIEKAMNCISCGACLITCKNNALRLNNTISVQPDKCTMCGQCISATELRGSCLRRNYSPVRFEVKFPIKESQKETEFDYKFSRLCSDTANVTGLIRSKVSLEEITYKLRSLGEVVFINDSTLIVRNSVFMATFRRNKSFTEVRFRAQDGDFNRVVIAIRDVLRKSKRERMVC